MLRRLVLLLTLVAIAFPGAARAEQVTIQVMSIAVAVKSIDAKPTGTSKGDRIVYRDNLLNATTQFGKAKGAKIGTDRGTMIFTSAHSARFDGSATLPGGTVRIKGAVKAVGTDKIQIPVVGGTGRYASATGTLTVGPGERQALNVYRLKLGVNVA